jgi:Ca2+ transporting ATPase
MENAFAKTPAEVLKYFSVSEAQGLTSEQVKASREKYGRNGIDPPCATSAVGN